MLVETLETSQLGSARAVERLHEALCWMAAYPDTLPLRVAVDRALRCFSRRRDLQRFRAQLADTGVAGTAIRYRFFWMMVRWLASRFPDRLRLDWDDPSFELRLQAALPFALRWDVAEAVRRSGQPIRACIDRLRGDVTDAVYVVRAIESISDDSIVAESLHDGIDPAYVIQPGHDGPSRTLACWKRAPVVVCDAPPPRGRPSLEQQLERPPREVCTLTPREGEDVIALARESMVTRGRDLAAFSWGDLRDVRWVDDGDGLSFLLVGSLPQRRLPLPVVYGWLMLRSGIPVGYVQTDSLLGGAEISFNAFPSFRGGEAGYLFARVLAVTRHLLGAKAFSIEPYQLGWGNEEGIETGAFWFYEKFGFRPHDLSVRRVLARERQRMQANPRHRSDEATLRRLAAAHVYWTPAGGEHSWLPRLPGLGLALPTTTDHLARAAKRLGVSTTHGWTADERRAWERLAPVVAALPGIERWSRASRQTAIAVVRAKGSRRESEFGRALDEHRPMSAALIALLRGVKVPRVKA